MGTDRPASQGRDGEAGNGAGARGEAPSLDGPDNHDAAPRDLLPLSAPVYHILLALADGELHGYGIILAVEDATDGMVRLSTGTLYTAMRRLVDAGLLEEVSQSEHESTDRRRYYRLTSFGGAVARAESRRIASLAALARSKGFLARGARPHFGSI